MSCYSVYRLAESNHFQIHRDDLTRSKKWRQQLFFPTTLTTDCIVEEYWLYDSTTGYRIPIFTGYKGNSSELGRLTADHVR
jgi:hypothetical protein